MFYTMNPRTQKIARMLLAAGPLFLAATGFGQVITNPSFELDSFTVSPGYISGNSPITGWTANDNSRAGISLTGGGSPFVNNGAIPNGTKGAFIQSGVA